jgi:hypothetical protein
MDGNTHYYIRLEGNNWYFTINVSDAPLCAILNPGDRVRLESSSSDGELRTAYTVERAE